MIFFGFLLSVCLSIGKIHGKESEIYHYVLDQNLNSGIDLAYNWTDVRLWIQFFFYSVQAPHPPNEF